MNFFKGRKAKIRSEPDEQSFGCYMTLPDFLKAQSEGYTPLHKNPDVKVCIKKIADLVSSMPIYQMKNTNIGNVRLVDGVSRKVDISPSQYLTRKTLIYKCVEELLLYGNSFLLPIHDRQGFLQELKPVESRTVSLNALEDGGYIARVGGVDFESDEIINFVNNPRYDEPWRGNSYKLQLFDVIRNLRQNSQIRSDFYTNQYKPRLVFLFNGDNDVFKGEEERDETFKTWLKTKPGQPYMLPGSLIDIKTFQNMSLSDIAINESAELDKRFIAALIGVPAFFLGIGEYNEKEYNNFIDTTIRPIAEILQQELTKKLLIADDRFFKFNINSLKAFDMDSRLSAMYEGKAMGVFNADEVRVVAGYEPTGLPEMIEYTMLENYIPVKDASKQKKLQGGDKDGNEGS